MDASERGFKMVKDSGDGFFKPILRLTCVAKIVVLICVVFNQFWPSMGLRPLREMDAFRRGQILSGTDDAELGPFSAWNITGSYKGKWGSMDLDSNSSRFKEFRRCSGSLLLELVSSTTKIAGVHYVHGLFIFQDVLDTEHDLGDIHLRVEGVYIWPFRQLRLVSNRDNEFFTDGILLGGIVVMYEMHSFLQPILLLLYSFWIPQIIANVTRDSRKPLHPCYILGITVSRLAIPLYVFGCPNNFMRIARDWNWCLCLIIFVGLQAIILLLQHYFGSRWFIPHQILPEKYNYHRRVEQNIILSSDCVICMTPVDLAQRSDDFMVTPYEHFFHTCCLQRWMDIKMECPTCRRPLPPI